MTETEKEEGDDTANLTEVVKLKIDLLFIVEEFLIFGTEATIITYKEVFTHLSLHSSHQRLINWRKDIHDT